MSSNWQQTLGLFDRSYKNSPVNGEAQKFYSLSGQMIIELKPVIKSVSKALLSMYNTVGKDFVGNEQDERFEGKSLVRIITSTKEASPELIQKQYDLQNRAMDEGIEGLVGDEIEKLIPKIIMDSMRDVFTRNEKGHPVSHPTPTEFYENTPAEVIVDMAKGVWKANEGLLNPFQGALEDVMDGIREKTLDKVGIQIPGSSSNEDTSGSQEKEATEL